MTKPLQKQQSILIDAQVDAVVQALKRLSSKSTRDGMLRFGIPNDNALGVPVGKMQNWQKSLVLITNSLKRSGKKVFTRRG